jgi:hypothetical protein
MMATQFTWVIEWMNTKPVDGNLQDVVVTAGWRCNGLDGGHFASVYGSCAFSSPGDPFTPYNQLTQDQVLGWCWASGVDKAAVETSVADQIQDQINPPVVALPLPW